jgi:hypothetical protein
MVTRLQDFTPLIEVGLSRVFKEALPTYPLIYKKWLATVQAKEWIEDEDLVTGFGAMPEKPIGNPFTTDSPKIGTVKQYTMKAYGLGFVIEHELRKWDKYSVFGRITRKLAWSGQDRKNITAYAILNNGFSTADAVYTTYASEALFSTSHALLRGGTAKNAPTTAVAVSYLGLQEAMTDFRLLTNEDGLYIMLSPECLIVHPSKAWIAETQLQSQYRTGNANMEKNTLSGKLKIHDSPYLTSQTAYFVLSSKQLLRDNAMSFHMGEDLSMRRDYERSTWNLTFQMYGSWRVAVYHWYGTWGSQGA